MRIAIQPFGPVPQPILEELAEDLGVINADVEIRVSLSLPEGSYNPRKGQYHADAFLEVCDRQPGDRILGVTSVDLYAQLLNFVFGQAALGGRAAVISIARLAHRDHGLFRDRVAKEAIHELGHTFGFTHCPDDSCVMHFSDSLADTDLKGKAFCESCAASLPKGLMPKRR